MGLHRGAALGALLLLAVPACRAPTTGAASHVRWLTIFDWDPQRTHSFVNLLQRTPGGNSKSTSLLANSSLIQAWQTYGTPGLLDIEDVGGGFSEGLYIRQGISKTHLNPRWKSLLALTLVAYVALAALFAGIYALDPLGMGVGIKEAQSFADMGVKEAVLVAKHNCGFTDG